MAVPKRLPDAGLLKKVEPQNELSSVRFLAPLGFRGSDHSDWNIETSSVRGARVTALRLGRSLNRKLEIPALR